MMDDLETRLRSAFRARAAAAPHELRRGVPAPGQTTLEADRPRRSKRLVPIAAAATVLAVMAAGLMIAWQMSDSDAPASDGITLNTSSWSPDDENAFWMQSSIGGTVRVDAKGCVYLEGFRSDVVINVAWPSGFTASRQPDGTVAVADPDGVVVAATGHDVRFGGGDPFDDIELACTAKGSSGGSVMVTDVLPPLAN